jgi:hypothetical protein
MAKTLVVGKIQVVGYQFPTGDVTVVKNDDNLPRLVSVTTDMKMFGLEKEQWIFIDAGIGYARIWRVGANFIDLEVTSNAVVDIDHGTNFRIFLAEWMRYDASTQESRQGGQGSDDEAWRQDVHRPRHEQEGQARRPNRRDAAAQELTDKSNLSIARLELLFDGENGRGG